MTSKVPFEQAQTLIERYKATFEKRYGQQPTLNVVQAKWDLVDIIGSLGYQEVNKLFAYFFRTKGSHDFSRFIYEYHDMYRMMKLQEADAERRKRLHSVKLD